jgi:squalene-hopene/tetraprenyl-beta-curcumene cyclase
MRILTISTIVLLLANVPGYGEHSKQLVTSTQSAGPLHESLQREVDAAIDRGLEWLAAKQKENGSWSDENFPALTALPLWALASAPASDARSKSADAAVRHILSCAHDSGAIYKVVEGRKGGGLSNYNTAICMTALHATGRADLRRTIQKARTFIAGSQYSGDDVYNGGFGYDASTKRAYTDLLNTFFSAQAMRVTASVEDSRPKGEKRADIDWAATVKFVESLQNKPEAGKDDEGGLVYNPVDPKAGTTTNAAGEVVFRSYGSITYAGLLALVFADVATDDIRVRSALDWTERHWTLEENPGMGQQGLFFFYHVLARALNAADHDTIVLSDGTHLNWRESLARKLVSIQQTDPDTGHGYWVNKTGRFWESDRVLATSYSLLALLSL